DSLLQPPTALINSLHGHPAENRRRRHILHHHHHLQPPPPLPTPCERRPLPRNPSTLPHRRCIQTPRLRRHARPRPPAPHPEHQNHLADHEPHQGRFLPRLASKVPVWQRGFADHLILDRDHFESRRT